MTGTKHVAATVRATAPTRNVSKADGSSEATFLLKKCNKEKYNPKPGTQRINPYRYKYIRKYKTKNHIRNKSIIKLTGVNPFQNPRIPSVR